MIITSLAVGAVSGAAASWPAVKQLTDSGVAPVRRPYTHIGVFLGAVPAMAVGLFFTAHDRLLKSEAAQFGAITLISVAAVSCATLSIEMGGNQAYRRGWSIERAWAAAVGAPVFLGATIYAAGDLLLRLL